MIYEKGKRIRIVRREPWSANALDRVNVISERIVERKTGMKTRRRFFRIKINPNLGRVVKSRG